MNLDMAFLENALALAKLLYRVQEHGSRVSKIGQGFVRSLTLTGNAQLRANRSVAAFFLGRDKGQ